MKSSRRSFLKSKCLHVFLVILLTALFRKFRKMEGFSRGPIKEEWKEEKKGLANKAKKIKERQWLQMWTYFPPGW